MSSITLCAIGKTGIGRSTLLNSILGKETFRTAAQDGRVTVSCDTEHGSFLGKKELDITLIDTPGLIEKNSNSQLGEQISYANFLSFIESLSKGFNLILLCFDVNNIRFDSNTVQIIEFLQYLFGEEVYKHFAIVFTMCDAKGAEDKIIKAKSDFAREFQHQMGNTTNLPLFFTKKDSTQDLDGIVKFAGQVGKFDCKLLTELKKIQQDETKTRLDQEQYIEEVFKTTILKVMRCNIL